MSPSNQKREKKNPTTKSRDYDRIVLEAVEAGIESGRSMGIIEAYNFLLLEGYTSAAETLMQLITEDETSRNNKANA